MPCSALIEPPSSTTMSCTMRLMRSRSAAKRGPVPVQRPHRVVVHVAVADVAEGAVADAGIGGGDSGIGALDELRDARQRHRYVVGDRCRRPKSTASGRLSRIFQSLAACAPEAAISASRTRPASCAAASASARGRAASLAGPGSSRPSARTRDARRASGPRARARLPAESR